MIMDDESILEVLGETLLIDPGTVVATYRGFLQRDNTEVEIIVLDHENLRDASLRYSVDVRRVRDGEILMTGNPARSMREALALIHR